MVLTCVYTYCAGSAVHSGNNTSKINYCCVNIQTAVYNTTADTLHDVTAMAYSLDMAVMGYSLDMAAMAYSLYMAAMAYSLDMAAMAYSLDMASMAYSLDMAAIHGLLTGYGRYGILTGYGRYGLLTGYGRYGLLTGYGRYRVHHGQVSVDGEEQESEDRCVGCDVRQILHHLAPHLAEGPRRQDIVRRGERDAEHDEQDVRHRQAEQKVNTMNRMSATARLNKT